MLVPFEPRHQKQLQLFCIANQLFVTRVSRSLQNRRRQLMEQAELSPSDDTIGIASARQANDGFVAR
ncbi:MAG: hypothetical protein DME26_13160 [Verrucomicrobia bacterium]|nr:MAG: hypothetical protein DME26_13160 [Verrucomicrobiota bacterium]